MPTINDLAPYLYYAPAQWMVVVTILFLIFPAGRVLMLRVLTCMVAFGILLLAVLKVTP